MIVPCIVNAWLYCSRDWKTSMPGAKSSARISSARMPPMANQTNDVIRYRYPIVLWSVEVIHLITVRPRV